MSNEALHPRKKNQAIFVALCLLVGLLILAACTVPHKSEAYVSKDGLEFQYTYQGIGTETYLTFKGGTRGTHSFNTDADVKYVYELEDYEQEYAIVYINDANVEYYVTLHLWKSKDPNRPADHVPQLSPTPMS